MGCDFRDANSQVVAELEIGANIFEKLTLGPENPESIQCRLLSAAEDWVTTENIYKVRATTADGRSRSWLINPDGEMSRNIEIDGEWAASGTEYRLDFTDKPDLAIAYAGPGCSDDDVSLAFSEFFPGFAQGD